MLRAVLVPIVNTEPAMPIFANHVEL